MEPNKPHIVAGNNNSPVAGKLTVPLYINAQSASLRCLLASESKAAETNAASSFERSPAMDQSYQI